MAKVKFNEDRGSFQKNQVVEMSDEHAAHIIATGKKGSVELAADDAKVTSKDEIIAKYEAKRKKKAEELKKKADQLEKDRG